MRLLTILLLLVCCCCKAQHPVAFGTAADFGFLRANLSKLPVLKRSYDEVKRNVDAYLGKDVDVPVPKDPQGGYTHDRHKENYTLIFNAGLLYNLTGDARYAQLAKQLFLKYAKLNPTLKMHPQATSSSPGHIFWQALNDANWLVYAGLGYDLIYQSLTPQERNIIEQGAFKPEVDFITGDLESWFNLLHNHGVWACAGVGITGIATGNENYVRMALYGSKGDGKSGLLAQMDNLFSPDGYYTEGPYYVRYAILPYYLFANALNNARPELKIFQYRDSILRKALMSGLQQTNVDGKFFPFNDALKEKDFTSNELVTAMDIARMAYGKDAGLTTVAQKQDRVLLHRGGALMAAEIATSRNESYFPYRSVEYRDGARGNEGGISILRSGKEKELTSLVLKYASHGLSHGHYDQLGFFMYDDGNEVFQDYGSVRFIGVEQKWGGRYLPENKTYAGQTIAHSTVVIDEKSQFDGKENIAEQFHGEKRFSSIGGRVQVVSASDTHAYPDAKMFRSMYMIELPGRKKPLLIDIYRIASGVAHQYDLPFQFSGTLINTSFRYKAASTQLTAMGSKNGYQFLWKEAEASLKDTMAQFTFLNNAAYYSISTIITDTAKVFFARTGAGDSNFNLRREPSYIIRKSGSNEVFLSCIEIHGSFDAKAEFSTNSYPSVTAMRFLRRDSEYTIASIQLGAAELIIMQAEADIEAGADHNVNVGAQKLSWRGPFAVMYKGKFL